MYIFYLEIAVGVPFRILQISACILIAINLIYAGYYGGFVKQEFPNVTFHDIALIRGKGATYFGTVLIILGFLVVEITVLLSILN